MGTSVVTDEDVALALTNLEWINDHFGSDSGESELMDGIIDTVEAMREERKHYGPSWRARAEGAEEAEKELREALRSVHAKLDALTNLIADRLHMLEEVV
jgi:hypothetical protein